VSEREREVIFGGLVAHLFPEMNDDLTGLGDASFFPSLQNRQRACWRRDIFERFITLPKVHVHSNQTHSESQ